MSHLYSNCPPYWNSNERRISDSLSKSLSLNMDSPPQVHNNTRSLGFHLLDQDSPSSQSTQSNHDLTATAGTNAQDKCMSTESGQEVSGGRTVGGGKPVYLMGHPDGAFNATHIDYSRVMTCMPLPCGDPYFNGLMTPYGAAPAMQPQVMGVTSTRVPLPLDITEDEPIYVNAKQYNGILRRRQSRAKLEAQNKLIKARKPYLHESRHLHALNRVRGSGGRFLSTKKQQQSESNSANGHHSNRHSNNSFDHGNEISLGFETHYQSQGTTGTSTSSGDGAYFQHANTGFLGISSGGAMQRKGGFMNSQNQHCASIVK